jgi:hypothetical protein
MSSSSSPSERIPSSVSSGPADAMGLGALFHRVDSPMDLGGDDDIASVKAEDEHSHVSRSGRRYIMNPAAFVREAVNHYAQPTTRLGEIEGLSPSEYLALVKALRPRTYTRAVNRRHLQKSNAKIPMPQFGLSFHAGMIASFFAAFLLAGERAKLSEIEFVMMSILSGGGPDTWEEFVKRRNEFILGKDDDFSVYLEKMAELNCLRAIYALHNNNIPDPVNFVGRLMENPAEKRHFLNALVHVRTTKPLVGNIDYISRQLMMAEYGILLKEGEDCKQLIDEFLSVADEEIRKSGVSGRFYYKKQFLAVKWIAEALTRVQGNVYSSILRRLNGGKIWWENKSYSF